MRIETQNTIDTLREEFDQLVKELAKYKKKDELGGDVSELKEDNRSAGGVSQLSAQQPKGVAGIPKLKLGGAGK